MFVTLFIFISTNFAHAYPASRRAEISRVLPYLATVACMYKQVVIHSRNGIFYHLFALASTEQDTYRWIIAFVHLL